MKQIHIKNRLYTIPALLFYIGLQGTEATQTNTELSPNLYNHVSEQAFDDFNRKPHHHHHHHSGTQQNNPGFLDTSFSGNGYVTNFMGYSANARAVAIQENNKIVVGGIRDDYAVLARYNENGSLDSSFASAPYGPGVIIQLSLLKGSSFNAVAIQPDQKIVAVGDYGRNPNPAGRCLLTRYQQTDNGVILDQSFGVNGIIRTNITGALNAVAIQKDGKIVVAGYNTYNSFSAIQMIILRYNIDGTLDNSFGHDGILIPISRALAHGITIQKNNKIVIVGTFKLDTQNDILVVRCDKDGILDPNFGPNHSGIVTLARGKNNSIAYDVAIQENGQIIVAGTHVGLHDKNVFTIIRLHANGSPDINFGTSQGTASIVPITTNDNSYARSVAINENGRIVVMGYTIVRVGSTNNNYFSLVRLRDNGLLDYSFGNQGRMNTQIIFGGRPNITALPVVGAIQDNGEKIILAGNYFNPLDRNPREFASNHRFSVARYHN